MRSDSSNCSTKSCNGESLSTIDIDGSATTQSSRKSSFRFGRKKKSLAPGLSIIETNNEQQQVDTNEVITPLTDYSIQTNTSEYVVDGSTRPPLLPPTMSTTPVKSKATTLTQQQPKLMKRSRSLTPSDIHYLNSTESTTFGSVPISQHYETNEQLLDLFTTLYEKGVKTDPSVVENVAEGAGSMGTVDNQTTSSSEEYTRVAYAAGVKFVEVALFTIPQHGYYKSNENEYQDKRTKSIVDAVKVTQLLGELVDEDVEQKRIGRLSSVAYKSLEEVVKDGNNQKQGDEETSGYSNMNMDDVKTHISRIWNDARVEGDKILNQCVLPDDICSFLNICGGQGSMNYVVEEEDVIDKSVKRLSIHHGSKKRHKTKPLFMPTAMPQGDKDEDGDVNMASDTADEYDKYTPTFEKTKISSKPPLHTAPSSSSASVTQSSRVSMTSSTPSILTESAADEVSQVEKIKQAQEEPSPAEFDCNSALQLALSLSMTMEKGENNDVNIVSSCENTVATDSNVANLTTLYQEQYTSLREKGVFHIRFLDTYQGRNPLSTNGCTVIGPLLCIHYFTCSEENRVSSSASIFSEDKLYWDSGMPDELINQVIDDHAASILPVVRGNLNLGHDSFIIPSDVHDHLIEVGLLSTSSFVGVCGGNILDEQHLSSFKSTLLLLDDERERERLKGRKIGATLFFHAHVIAIHVIKSGDDVWIELIDSLPNPDTWINSCPNEVEMMDYEYSNEQIQNAIRLRCTDVEHFNTLILQYALTKFSEEEQNFIDNNQFDERNCESSFDPRVFQAFVWAEA